MTKTSSPPTHEHHPAAADHRALGHGGLRATVFGASDGLVSNAALVLGVASGTSEASVVILAGVAGLLAGAFSMAAGEWVSVTAQREALEGELAKEAAHLAEYPEAERRHMIERLAGAGLSTEVSGAIVDEIEQDSQFNLNFHARMELGIDPDELGSPTIAGGASFASFAVGAVIPLIPWAFSAGLSALLATIAVSAVALFAVGAALAAFTHRHWAWSGGRQLLVGAGAAAVTMVAGQLLGGGG